MVSCRMADRSNELNEIRKTLHAAGVTGPEQVGNENLGELKPSNPMLDYIRGLEDQLTAAHQEGKDLFDYGVTVEEKTITLETEPDHGLDR